MLVLKDRVLYEGAKISVEFTQKADITMYSLVLETVTGEILNLYVCDSKKVIDFVFDAIVAEVSRLDSKVVDVNYIIKNACE